MTENPTVIFSVINWALSGLFLLSLLMMLPNTIQQRISSEDRAGAGIAMIGLLLGLFAMLFATKVFEPMWGVYSLSSYFAMILSAFSGFAFFVGTAMALPDTVTDPFLDQANVKWLALVGSAALIVIVLVALL